jgi:hypothetical protein
VALPCGYFVAPDFQEGSKMDKLPFMGNGWPSLVDTVFY